LYKWYKLIKIARERSGVYVCEDEKQLLCHQYRANLSVLCRKCSENAKDADAKELCGSAPPHPVRCPVIKVMIAQARIFIHFCAVVLLFFVKTVIACFGL